MDDASPPGAADPLTRRLADRAWVTWRTSWTALAVGAVGGFAAQALLPLQDSWLAAAAAGAAAGVASLLLPIGQPQGDVAGLPPRTQVERWATPAQFGHAFATAALALAGFAAGAFLAAVVIG